MITIIRIIMIPSWFLQMYISFSADTTLVFAHLLT